MIGFGQWEKIYQHGYGAWEVEQTLDGGYMIYGYPITKTNSFGDTLWTLPFLAKSGEQTTDGGYVFIGRYANDTNKVIKTDQSGNILWAREYRGDKIIQTNDGGYAVILNSCSNYMPNNQTKLQACEELDFYKLDSVGNLLWIKTYFPEPIYGDNHGESLLQTNDGGFMIIGSGFSAGLLIKTNSQGDTLWTKTHNYIGTYNLHFNNGKQTSDGGYIITGEAGDTITNDYAVFLLKTDSNGNLVWFKYLSTDFGSAAFSVSQTTDGGYIITGLEENNASGDEMLYLAKTDLNGDTIWTKRFGNPCGLGHDAKQTLDGGYIVTGGYYHCVTGATNMVLLKTNSLGTLSSIKDINLILNPKKLLKITDILGRETKGTKNEPLFYIYDDGTVEKKIIIE